MQYAGWPYGKLMEELQNRKHSIKLSPVVQSLWDTNPSCSLLELVAEFADRLRERYLESFQKRNFTTMAQMATNLGFRVVGSPRQSVGFYVERPFFGCSFRIGGQKIIYLANPITQIEARATIAHDMMHSLFDTVNDQRPGNLPADEIEERLCDYGACRLLISDEELSVVLLKDTEGNLASGIAKLAQSLRVPRRFLAMRLFDPLSSLPLLNIEAVVEWSRKNHAAEATHVSVVPTWSVCRKAFIPWLGGKRSCHAKRDSVVANAMFSEGLYQCDSATEETSIGSLKGSNKVSVCVFGRKNSPKRRVLSVFQTPR